MGAATQDKIAFAIVALAAVAVLVSFFRATLAGPLSRLLLRRGKVKWAMKLKAGSKEPGCDHCKH